MTLQNKLDTIHSNVPQVHQAGRDQQRIAMWDYYQQGGARVDYDCAFTGYMWDKNSFYPTHNMQPIRANMMFFWMGFPWREEDKLVDSIDLVARLNECGVTLDFSRCKEMYRAFASSKINHVGTIDFADCRHTSEVNDAGNSVDIVPQPWKALFAWSQITTIDKLIFYTYNPPFDADWLPRGLVNVTCEGTIFLGGLDMSVCPNLTKESIMSFINCLADLSDAGFNQTIIGNMKAEGKFVVTLGADHLAKLTDEEKAIATNKGWTLA